MKHLKYIVMAFAVALLAASCSQDELLDDGGDTPITGQTQTYTFTVSPDLTMEGDTETRSEGAEDEMPTRCFMQILGNNTVSNVENGVQNENGSFTFSVLLPSNTDYTFLFWADNSSGDTPTDLRQVQYTPGTVAFAAKKTDTPENVISNEVSLKHIVTKITLRHNGANTFSPKTNDVMTATLPCATTYNISEETASGSEAHEFIYTFSEDAQLTAATDICNFYVLVPSNANKSIGIAFHDYALTIGNISMPSDTHITLSGDFSSNNEKWELPDAVREEAFQSCFYNDNGTPEGEESLGDYLFFTDQTTVQRFFDEILGIDKSTQYGISLFGHTITCIDYGVYMDFYVDDTLFLIYYGEMYQTMPHNFEVPTFDKNW